jgi:hypothetical protein
MRDGATEVNETQKWATSKKRLRTTASEDQYSLLFSLLLIPIGLREPAAMQPFILSDAQLTLLH